MDRNHEAAISKAYQEHVISPGHVKPLASDLGRSADSVYAWAEGERMPPAVTVRATTAWLLAHDPERALKFAVACVGLEGSADVRPTPSTRERPEHLAPQAMASSGEVVTVVSEALADGRIDQLETGRIASALARASYRFGLLDAALRSSLAAQLAFWTR